MSFFAKEIMDEEWGNYFELTGAGYGILIACMVALLLAACFLSGKIQEGKKIKLGTKQLVFSSMAMALAMVTSMIKLVDMPMGGSVTLFSMFFYLSYRLLVWPKGGIDDGGCLWLFAVDCGPLYH